MSIDNIPEHVALSYRLIITLHHANLNDHERDALRALKTQLDLINQSAKADAAERRRSRIEARMQEIRDAA